MAANFLTSWGPVSFSERTLFQGVEILNTCKHVKDNGGAVAVGGDDGDVITGGGDTL
jgi:hypothetical protein